MRKDKRRKASARGNRTKDSAEAKGIAKKDPQEYASKAESAFWSLSPEARDKIRASGKYDSYADWYKARQRKEAKWDKAGQSDLAKAARRARDTAPTLKMGSPKMLDKHIRKAMKMPHPPKNPYAALMAPMVIVPDVPTGKVVIADAGSIIRLMDQATLYRDRFSPITRRADELLVQYGQPKKLMLGWLTDKQPSTIMKPSKGPTFLVTTKSEDSLIAWEQLRLKIARTRQRNPASWLVTWLMTFGNKHPQLLREVTRYFGGKPVKNEAFDVRVGRLITLILKVELDMVNVKSKKLSKKAKKNRKQEADDEDEVVSSKQSKKAKKVKKTKTAKKDKPEKKAKKDKRGKKKAPQSRITNPDKVTKAHDNYVIKRLIKENPRRAGTHRAKVWDKLRKGMTVAEFVAKGGARTVVRHYRQLGWVKLLRPKGE